MIPKNPMPNAVDCEVVSQGYRSLQHRFAVVALAGTLFFSLNVFAAAKDTSSASASPSSSTKSTQGVKMPRLFSLEKLTVGPDNHFQVAISGDEDQIFFTRSSNLATRLFWRGLKGGESLGQVQPFVKAEYDTKDPSLNGDGSKIAFVSFEKRARGDVCVQDVSSNSQNQRVCAEEKLASEQPFWINSQTVAYIRRPIDQSRAQLVSWDISSNTKKVLFEDQIFSANADSRGRWIVYSSMSRKSANGLTDIERGLKVFRLSDAQSWSLRIAIPGVSSFPHFDERGESVYFSQFSNDTNADSRIDGNDNGVLFRIPVGFIEDSKTVILPEQLTTAEQNCNYPAPGRIFLYVTCAFEGSLDVYRLPLTGLVPLMWSEQNLLDAYRTSRSVSERTLIINTLRYRFDSYRRGDALEKILSQHILTGEYQAAQFYLDLVQAEAPTDHRSGYSLLGHLLETLQYRASEKLDQISPEFISLLRNKRKIFEGEKGPYRSFANLALVYVDLSLRNTQAARERFNSIKVSQQRSPLEQHLYFSMGSQLLEQKLISLEAWFEIAAEIAQSAILTDEARAYVSALMISKISESNRTPAQRLSRLQALRPKIKAGSQLDTIVSSQEFILKVASATSDSEEDKSFQEFNKIFAKTSSQYYLNRALSVTAVLTLAEFNKTRVMGFVAANWLAAAKINDTEYMYAREQYITVVLDKAYGLWSKADSKSASQVFYSSVRLTDDQETHLGFVTTLMQDNNRKLIDERYASLKSSNFTAANLDFAKAVVMLFDDISKGETKDTDSLEDAEEILTTLKDDGSRPAGKHLLLGYIAHQKMLRTKKGFQFDEELSQTAHHQYMIALDLARQSPRLTARILQNLGMLHAQTEHFGLASGYFSAREKFGFENDQSRLTFLWNFTKALYRNGEFARAAEFSTEGLALAKKVGGGGEVLIGWLERTAFYLSQAERFKDASAHYTELLRGIESRSDENVIKALLMHGWTLMKSGEIKRAATAFDKLLVLAEKGQVRKASGEPGDVIEFRPERYSALALGLLTRMNSTPAGRIPLRAQRLKIMESWGDTVKSYALSKDNWLRLVLKDCVSQATDHLLANETEKSNLQLNACLKRASDAAVDSGEASNEGQLETLRVSWMLASRFAEKKVKLPEASLQMYLSLSRKALSELDVVAGASRPIAFRWLRLRAEQLAARHVLLPMAQRDFISRAEALSEIEKMAKSDRLELLTADERRSLSEHLERIKVIINQIGQG
jgi:hypothetical protein